MMDLSKYVEVEKIKEFKSLATTWAMQIAIDTARRLYKQEHGRYPLYPSTEEELLWIGNYAGEAMNSVVNEILGTNEPYKKKIGVEPYKGRGVVNEQKGTRTKKKSKGMV